MARNNMIIRKTMLLYGFKQYELARLLNISDNTLVRRMREEMPEEEQKRIADLIEKEAQKHGQ